MTMQAQIDRSSYFTDLARFAAAFESEDVLRKTIESLLAQIPTLSGVQRTHGTQEYGKDIIFYGPGALSETRLHACLVKNTPITGNVDSNAGARNVLFQAQQALDTSIVNSKGDSERVEQVYVMCPHELPQTTLNSIAGQLKSAGQVTFFCGHKLLKLFEDHWPEFLVFDSDLLPAYLNSLQAVLEKNTDLTNVVFRHSILGDISKQLSDIYAKPRFKQDLQEFKLSETPIPNISEVEAPIALQRTKELAEELTATGKVLDTLSIEREHVDATIKAKRVKKRKTDREDARLLLRLMRENNFPQIWVPGPENRDLRQLLWHRHRLVQMRTRIMNQLQALAMNEGYRWKKKLFSEQGRALLEKLSLAPWANRRRQELLELLDRMNPTIEELTAVVEREARKRPEVLRLMTHPGVGPLTALAYVLIIGTPTRFQRGKQIGTYVGMVPCEESSAGKQRLGHISKQGNSLLRFLLVEAAQAAARIHPDWRRRYIHLAMRRHKSIAKVAMGRRLAVRLYWMWRNGCEYSASLEFGSYAGQLGNRHGVK
jgi:transposase